eukprot:gene6642-12183_t
MFASSYTLIIGEESDILLEAGCSTIFHICSMDETCTHVIRYRTTKEYKMAKDKTEIENLKEEAVVWEKVAIKKDNDFKGIQATCVARGRAHQDASKGVVMKIRVKLKSKPKSKYKEQYDWNMLEDAQIREKYNIEVNNRFQSLNVEELQNLEEEWKDVKTALTL